MFTVASPRTVAYPSRRRLSVSTMSVRNMIWILGVDCRLSGGGGGEGAMGTEDEADVI